MMYREKTFKSESNALILNISEENVTMRHISAGWPLKLQSCPFWPIWKRVFCSSAPESSFSGSNPSQNFLGSLSGLRPEQPEANPTSTDKSFFSLGGGRLGRLPADNNNMGHTCCINDWSALPPSYPHRFFIFNISLLSFWHWAETKSYQVKAWN